MNRAEAEGRATKLAPCTCGRELPPAIRALGGHFANCPSELQPAIAALLAARAEALEEAGQCADNEPLPEYPAPNWIHLLAPVDAAITATKRAKKRIGRAIRALDKERA